MLSEICPNFEITCIDDDSTDKTVEIARQEVAITPAILLFALSKNFGKEGTLSAELNNAIGDAVAFIDADMEHPPKLLKKMCRQWKDGADIVECVKQNRGMETNTICSVKPYFIHYSAA